MISNSEQQILSFVMFFPHHHHHHHHHWDEVKYVAKWSFPLYIKQTGAGECAEETEKKENTGGKY